MVRASSRKRLRLPCNTPLTQSRIALWATLRATLPIQYPRLTQSPYMYGAVNASVPARATSSSRNSLQLRYPSRAIARLCSAPRSDNTCYLGTAVCLLDVGFRRRHGRAEPRRSSERMVAPRAFSEQKTREHAAAQPNSAFAYVMHGGSGMTSPPTHKLDSRRENITMTAIRLYLASGWVGAPCSALAPPKWVLGGWVPRIWRTVATW